MLGQILITFISVLVGVNLVPSVANTVDDALHEPFNNVTNVTGATASVIALVPLFFILGIVLVTVQSSITVLSKLGF